MKAEPRDCYVNHLSSAVPALQTSTNPVQTQDPSAEQTQPRSGSSCPKTSLSSSQSAEANPCGQTWGHPAPREDPLPGHSLGPRSYSSSGPERRATAASGAKTKWGSRVTPWADGPGLLYTSWGSSPGRAESISTSESTDRLLLFHRWKIALRTIGQICIRHKNGHRQQSRGWVRSGASPSAATARDPWVPGPPARAQVRCLQHQSYPKFIPGASPGGTAPQPGPALSSGAQPRSAPELSPAPGTSVTSGTSWCNATKTRDADAWATGSGELGPRCPVCWRDTFVAQPARAGHESLPVTAGCLLPPVLSSPPLPSAGNKAGVYLAALC